jgi:hypothetical protein
MIINTDEDPSQYLNFRISYEFQKWNEFKHVLTDKRIMMSTRLLYSVQAWELSVKELRKIETIWHNFLRKMITNGFKRKNVPLAYLKAKRSNPVTPKPDVKYNT